ncbi:MAG: hypothetical protein JF621_03340 [Streptomyces turgidiscabies]|nr:hypothetical protein [Streptomyces turgidiscabies]
MELSFTVAGAQAGRALVALRGSGAHSGVHTVRREAPVAKVSLLGTGLRCDARVDAAFYEAVSRAGYAYGLASPSATGICAVVREPDALGCARAARPVRAAARGGRGGRAGHVGRMRPAR